MAWTNLLVWKSTHGVKATFHFIIVSSRFRECTMHIILSRRYTKEIFSCIDSYQIKSSLPIFKNLKYQLENFNPDSLQCKDIFAKSYLYPVSHSKLILLIALEKLHTMNILARAAVLCRDTAVLCFLLAVDKHSVRTKVQGVKETDRHRACRHKAFMTDSEGKWLESHIK